MHGSTQAHTLKEGSVAPPMTDLAAEFHQHTLNNAVDPEAIGW
jgi:hypothetical protein